MSASAGNPRASRYIDTQYQEISSTPIAGYQLYPLVSLMEALKHLANDLNEWKKSIGEAYTSCTFPSDHGLTREESAALYLYTMQMDRHSFYSELNKTLKSGDRQKILPWFSYLKLFDSALNKLPDFKGSVWRGIRAKVNESYKQEEIYTWWNITSCSAVLSVVEQFMQLPKDFIRKIQKFVDTTKSSRGVPADFMALAEGFTKKEWDSTLFMIQVCHGKDISAYSCFPDEKEVVLRMGTTLYVPSKPLDLLGTLATIHLNEIGGITPPFLAQWTNRAVTIAGGHGEGGRSHQLKKPNGIFITKDQTVYIADYENDRIVAWKHGASSGKIVAGGHGKGDGLNQLDGPRDVAIDPMTNNLLICDQNNRRIVVWPLSESSSVGEVSVFNISCARLTVDSLGRFYVSDSAKHEVRRFEKDGDSRGTLVAGGHGPGEGLDQLKHPTHLFVNADSTLFISDSGNHRVMKWKKGASQGIVVAGGNGAGKQCTQLSTPQGVWADIVENVYVVDHFNHRVMFWEKGAQEGKLIVGGNGCGDGPTHLSHPQGLFFDWKGNLYVADSWNHRIQSFSIH